MWRSEEDFVTIIVFIFLWVPGIELRSLGKYFYPLGLLADLPDHFNFYWPISFKIFNISSESFYYWYKVLKGNIYVEIYIYIYIHIWIYLYEKRVREPQAIMTSWRIFHKLNTPKQAAPQKHPHTKYSFLISVIIYHNLISVIVLYCLML